MHWHRREFLAGVGKGMIVASVGAAAASDLGLAWAWAEEGSDELPLGRWEPLANLLVETPLERLLPTLVEKIQAGTTLDELVAAAAMANARKFGGEDYIGFHTLMALAPAWHMARELKGPQAALPVLKVLYRNTARLQETGGRSGEVLHPIEPAVLANDRRPTDVLREQVRQQDVAAAEATYAALATRTSPEDAFEHLLHLVEDNVEVHRTVLPYRAWALLDLVGREHAHTMLRQSVRYCVRAERGNNGEARRTLEALFDRYRLEAWQPGRRDPGDAWVEGTAMSLIADTPAVAAETIAAALADGVAPSVVAEAIALAANELLLRDPGRPEQYADRVKPAGSVHGDSLGVHASDCANAWRNMGLASTPRHQAAGLVLSAIDISRSAHAPGYGVDFSKRQPQPVPEVLAQVTADTGDALLAALEDSIRQQNQALACAVVHRYGVLGYSERPVFDLLLRYAISEDGALHAEKYYRTVSEEFYCLRPAFRWRELVALARVTASEYGRPAPGYQQACELLKV
ncbi:MAG: hypothetical protein K6T86_14230 [Pirellulales bacterium]|nr:hypothetical protein [Pirellulales bacterium]